MRGLEPKTLQESCCASRVTSYRQSRAVDSSISSGSTPDRRLITTQVLKPSPGFGSVETLDALSPESDEYWGGYPSLTTLVTRASGGYFGTTAGMLGFPIATIELLFRG